MLALQHNRNSLANLLFIQQQPFPQYPYLEQSEHSFVLLVHLTGE
jgi:hypothetical protein